MFSQLLASDNKIYINTFGGSKFFTVINDPDSAGFACHVVQNQLVIPQYNIAMPNFANYKLKGMNIYRQQKPCCNDTLVAGSTTVLTMPHLNGITYGWYDEHGNLLGNDTTLSITADSTTTYYIVYTDTTADTLSCQSFMDSVKIYVYRIPPQPFDTTCDIYLPSLLNSGQYLKNITITEPYKLRVFNILGELIYSSDDYKGEWQPPTSGFYILETACETGSVRVRKLVVE